MNLKVAELGGSTTHQFVSYPQNDDVAAKILFYQELWAYIPSTRRRKSESIPESIIDKIPDYCSTVTTKSNVIYTLTANNPLKRHTVADTSLVNVNKPRLCDIFVHVTMFRLP